MEEVRNHFRYLIGGYYGIYFMDEYPLKEYILKDIMSVIEKFKNTNPNPGFSYIEEENYVKEKVSEKTKLQDALLVLNEIQGPMDLVFLVKDKLKKWNHK